MTSKTGSEPPAGFRAFLPDLGDKRFTSMKNQNIHEYTSSFEETGHPPWLHSLVKHWRKLFNEPYRGITTNGTVRDGLFTIQDEGVPIESIVEAASNVLQNLDSGQRHNILLHIDSPEWRSWSNPEYLLSNKGLRLDELTEPNRANILKLLEATLSQEGFKKAIGAMRMNKFLGELVGSPLVLNEYSYNFVIFGEPSTSRPWGFSFYGHHLCLNIFLYRTQIVASPCFTGAEPNIIDHGTHLGTRILAAEEVLGLRLMQGLSAEDQNAAQTYKKLKDPNMPWGRWNHDDQRHLCGAYRDNRVVPCEGILVSDMTSPQQSLVLKICEEYLSYLPRSAQLKRLAHIKSWFHETYWSWIGGYGEQDPFYYRIQSPVIIVEFDHHSGVFLANKEPARFHIHTLLRTPNAGDYGMALRPLIPLIPQEFTWEAEPPSTIGDSGL